MQELGRLYGSMIWVFLGHVVSILSDVIIFGDACVWKRNQSFHLFARELTE